MTKQSEVKDDGNYKVVHTNHSRRCLNLDMFLLPIVQQNHPLRMVLYTDCTYLDQERTH